MGKSYFLNKNLKFLREGNRWSQEEAAEKYGVTRSKIASYERGTEPDASILAIICRTHKVSIEDLVEKDMGAVEGEVILYTEERPDDKYTELQKKLDDCQDSNKKLIDLLHQRHHEG